MSTSPTPHRYAEATIMKLAADQYGLVTRAQLLRAGITVGTIRSRLRAGRLIRIHSGVYQVGPIEVPYQREMAAVLACGPNAAVSHASAAEFWKILPHRDPSVKGATSRSTRQEPQRPIDITLRTGRRRKRPGIRIHTRNSAEPYETTVHRGIPVTTPAQTLVDLASSAAHRDLERAAAEAVALQLVTPTDVLAIAARHRRHAGAPNLQRLVEGGAPAFTRSEAERRLLDLTRKARLGNPELNTRIEGYEVDFLWRRQRLIVEVDGRSFHVSERAFERDRRRSTDLTALGYRVVHVTWKQIVNEPQSLIARIAQALVR